nr:MAG TPA: hypothetical protein [Caudoviricetes sp.]
MIRTFVVRFIVHRKYIIIYHQKQIFDDKYYISLLICLIIKRI